MSKPLFASHNAAMRDWRNVTACAMDAGLADVLFWGTLAFSLAVAFVVTLPVNRALIRRGKGHAVVYSHHHGGGRT